MKKWYKNLNLCILIIMEYITIGLLGFLSLLLISIGIFIYFIIQKQAANSWQVAKNLIDTSTTPVNIISCCINGVNHCMSDSILATESNNYNSLATCVFLSTDNGANFANDIFPIPNLQIYGISSDGYTIAGIGQNLESGETSLWMTIDGSTTWNSIDVSGYVTIPYGVAMDISGTYLCICGNDTEDSIWYCNNNYDTDGNPIWTKSNAPNGYWLNITMSTDVDSNGVPLLSTALYSGNGDTIPDIYYSTDGCKTWTASGTLSTLLLSTIPNTNLSNCNGNNYPDIIYFNDTMSFVFQSMSKDGTYISVIVNTYVYISSDSGKTWSQSNTNPNITDWCTISVSSDGKTQLLCSNTNGVYQSTDYGQNWLLQDKATTAMYTNIINTHGTVTSWTSATIFDGGQIATTFQYFYYTFQSPPTMYILSTVGCVILFSIILILAFYYKLFSFTFEVTSNTT